MTETDIFHLLPDGLIIIGPERAVTDLNRAAERLTGWRREDAIGRPWSDVLRLRDAAGFLVHERGDPFATAVRIVKGAPEREYLLHRHDGEDRWVAMRAIYDRAADGAVRRVLATVRDLGRKQRLERTAYDLIATLAHDLRSPLTSVKGFTSTMLRNWGRFNDEQKQHMLHTIDWDADRMERLLKDLLDFSRLEAGRLELRREPLDVAEVAGKVAGRIAVHAKEHTITTNFAPPFPEVPADRAKLEQVLTNLIENAVKHGDPGMVAVTGEQRDEHIVVRVADSGPGIEPQHVPYIFTKFYRRSTGERHAGTGLGLYICKGIIEAHGGDIRVERTDPSGTVFAFTLPLED